MKSGKIYAALCAAFAVLSALLIALTVMNLTKKPDPQSEAQSAAANMIVGKDTVSDAAGDTVRGVIENNYKSVSFPDGILESMKTLYALNSDVAGYISIPGTEMSTPVMISDNNDYYLKRDFYKRLTSDLTDCNYGNIFLDYRCTPDYLSKNMIIYGHTTGKSTGVPKQAFRSLYDYKNKQHFIDCPIIKYNTLYEEYTYKICAVFLSTTEGSADGGYVFNYIYPDMSDGNMVGYIEQVKQRMLYETGVTLEPTDSVITLSTCIYDYGKSVDTRLVVVGRLLHEGESESIDASLVKDNPNYRRPQVWYNSNGKENPYKNSRSWQPSPN